MVQDHRTVTVWAVRRERYGDLLIHPAGNRSGGPLPVCRARLASRRLRVTFGFPLGKRCGASLVSSQRLFQLLPQALVLRQCALQLLLQGLDSPFEFLLPIRGANAIGGLHPFHDDTNAEICSELSLKVLYLLSYPLVNILTCVLRLTMTKSPAAILVAVISYRLLAEPFRREQGCHWQEAAGRRIPTHHHWRQPGRFRRHRSWIVTADSRPHHDGSAVESAVR